MLNFFRLQAGPSRHGVPVMVMMMDVTGDLHREF